jgi:hypothetical protein
MTDDAAAVLVHRLKSRQSRAQRRGALVGAGPSTSFRTQRSPYWGPFRVGDVGASLSQRAAEADEEGLSPPSGPAGNDGLYASIASGARPRVAEAMAAPTRSPYATAAAAGPSPHGVTAPVLAAMRHARVQQIRQQLTPGQRDQLDDYATARGHWPRPDPDAFRSTMVPASPAAKRTRS